MALAAQKARPPINSRPNKIMAAIEFVKDPDFVDVRRESWYPSLVQSTSDKVGAASSKTSFKVAGGEIMLVGVEVRMKYMAIVLT